MTFLLAVAFLILIVPVSVYGVGILVGKKDRHAEALPPQKKLSPPAKALVREYNALPDDARPFEDIVSLVEVLDDLTSLDDYERDNQHFNDAYLPYTNVYQGNKFRWIARGSKECRHQRCKFKEYYNLHQSIAVVAEAVKKKERAIKESQYAGDTQMIAELHTRLRQEAGLQTDFVRKFKELS